MSVYNCDRNRIQLFPRSVGFGPDFCQREDTAYKMKNPFVSIIIPVYNVEGYVGECLRSVMCQTSAEEGIGIECLVVDDRGTDGSMNEVRETLEGYAGPVDFRIISREANGGLSAARNSGLHEATGKYVYFLDSDDIITPDCISLLATAARKYPGAELVIGDFQTFPEEGMFKNLMIEFKNVPEHIDNIEDLHFHWFFKVPEIACNKLVKRDWIEANSLYFLEGIIHEDTHWRALMYSYATEVAFVNQKTYLYRMRPGSIMKSQGYLDKRVKNLSKLYIDLFSKPLRWDRPLVNWAFNILSIMRNPEGTGFDPILSREEFNNMERALKANKEIPWIARFMSCFFHLPRPLRRGRILTLIFDIFLRR